MFHLLFRCEETEAKEVKVTFLESIGDQLRTYWYLNQVFIATTVLILYRKFQMSRVNNKY